MKRYSNKTAKHLFDVQIRKYDATKGKYVKSCVEVEADNRSLASSVMAKLGYEVFSVNMVG